MIHSIKFNQFPWHTILFSLFPILALAAYNINQINIRVVYRPLLVSLAAALLLLYFVKMVFGDWYRAGLLTTLFLILFFSYGHVYNILHNIKILDVPIVRNRTLAILWLFIAGFCIWYVLLLKNKEWLVPLSRVLNIIIASLTVFQLGSLLWFGYKINHANIREQVLDSTYVPNGTEIKSTTLPDIYYIILDSYGRSDVIRSSFGIDNTAFLSQLQGLGFFVAGCSMSNYAQTEMSLASSLNFNYLDTLAIPYTPNRDDTTDFVPFIKNSATRRILEDQWYQTVAFATGYYWTEWENADYYFSPGGYWNITEFETMILRSSAGLILIDSGLLNTDQVSAETIRGRTLYVLDMLGSLPSDLTPKFVFVHLIIPHHPFVFGPNGESILIGSVSSEGDYSQEEYSEGYGDQVNYINSRITGIVSKIIAGSRNPPIIIIQGDHGPGLSSNQDRMSILNAYYLPGKSSLLYKSITPVNTFRVIFDEYFHGNYELLEDVSYYSSYYNPANFKVIQNGCPSQ
jgi:hypothetical protein